MSEEELPIFDSDIIHKHVRFMTTLQRIRDRITPDQYYLLEGEYKDMCLLAQKARRAKIHREAR